MLQYRSNETEIMDDFNLEGQAMDKTLKELQVINKWLGGDYVTIAGIEEIIKQKNLSSRSIIIADLGCGGGDMLIKIAKWARKKKLKVKLIGVDANNYIVDYAKKHSASFPEIEYYTTNIFSEEFKKLRFDIITSTLFTHHFSDKELIELYKQMQTQALHGILTNDIHRHWLAYYSINTLTSLFSKSYMVKNDAGVSVKRSFKKAELRYILDRANIKGYKIRWMWAFRWQIIAITKNSSVQKQEFRSQDLKDSSLEYTLKNKN